MPSCTTGHPMLQMLVTSTLLVMGFQKNSSPSLSSFDWKYFSSTGAKVENIHMFTKIYSPSWHIL